MQGDSTQVATFSGGADVGAKSSAAPDNATARPSAGNERRYFGDYELLEESDRMRDSPFVSNSYAKLPNETKYVIDKLVRIRSN